MRYRGKLLPALYVVALVAWVYGVLDRQLLYGSDVAGWIAVVGVALVHAALGFALNRGWALLLPLLIVPIALPAGYPSANKGEPLPLWLGQLYFLPFYVACVSIGIGLGRLRERRLP